MLDREGGVDDVVVVVVVADMEVYELRTEV